MSERPDWDAVALATAELLCATFQRHKPRHGDGVYACDRCRETAGAWTGWVRQGAAKVDRSPIGSPPR